MIPNYDSGAAYDSGLCCADDPVVTGKGACNAPSTIAEAINRLAAVVSNNGGAAVHVAAALSRRVSPDTPAERRGYTGNAHLQKSARS